jgi:hypothetical protein
MLHRIHFPPPARIHLAAWVKVGQINFRAEILDADASTQEALIHEIEGRPYHIFRGYVPFSALQSVALCDGYKVLEAFGRPPAAHLPAPAWIQFAEV